MKVAFLGLGLMGLPMTLNLVKAGHTVYVWNRNRDKLKPALDAGATACATPRAAAEAADVLCMCVMDAKAVGEVVFGADGVASAPARGQTGQPILVDHSSIPPDVTRGYAAKLQAANGIAWVDAPVSGGVAGAKAGTLAVMAGGDAAAVDKVRPLLAAYARQTTHMGVVGTGQITKLINQILVVTTVVTVAEATRLAQKAGVDARRIPEALAGGFADSKPMQIWMKRIVEGYDEPIGALSTFAKDIDTALDLSREVQSPLLMGAIAQQIMRTMLAQGKGEDDPAVIADLYRPPVFKQ